MCILLLAVEKAGVFSLTRFRDNRGMLIEPFYPLQHKATFMAPIGIGAALLVCELVGVPYTGGSLNPVGLFRYCLSMSTTSDWLISGQILWTRGSKQSLFSRALDLLGCSLPR